MDKKHKFKKCKQCGVKFAPQYSSLQICCSIKCAREYNTKKEIDKRHKELKKGLKEQNKVSLLRDVSKRLVQKFARLRDKDLPCISCDSKTAQEWHGGHLFKAELYSGVLLSPKNVNKQCNKCNIHMDGNEAAYVLGFIKKYGQEAFNDLAEEARKTKNKKWDALELTEIIAYFKAEIKKLEGK